MDDRERHQAIIIATGRANADAKKEFRAGRDAIVKGDCDKALSHAFNAMAAAEQAYTLASVLGEDRLKAEIDEGRTRIVELAKASRKRCMCPEMKSEAPGGSRISLLEIDGPRAARCRLSRRSARRR